MPSSIKGAQVHVHTSTFPFNTYARMYVRTPSSEVISDSATHQAVLSQATTHLLNFSITSATAAV